MGIVASAIAAGIGSAVDGKKFDNEIFGSGKRGCNGQRSKSYSKVDVPRKFKCRHIDRIEWNLAPEKYPQGIGYYMRDPRHDISNDNHLIKVENCKIPNSCRRDCSDMDRWWRGFKKQFTHINKQGMARRLVTSGCAIKDTGQSCSGVPCMVYHKVSKELHDQHGAELEARWARAIEDFQNTGLGKALGFVPLVGSTMELAFKDLSGKRPTAGDWIAFGVDVLAAVAPGLGFAGAASKIGKIAAAAGRQGFRNARVAFQIGSTSAARIAAKTVVLSITKNPIVRQSLKQAAYRQMAILATKGGAHGVAYAVRSNGDPYLTGLTDAQQREVASTVDGMIHRSERQRMAEILKEIDDIPFAIYKKFKTKSGEDKDVAAAKDKLATARKRMDAAKTPAERAAAFKSFEKLKDSAAGDTRKQSVRLGYERPITGTGRTRADAEKSLRDKNGVLSSCAAVGGRWICNGRQYRIKKNGKWTSWGIRWSRQVADAIRDAEEEHYGVAQDMSDRRWLKAETARVGAVKALKNFEKRTRILAAKKRPKPKEVQPKGKPTKSKETKTPHVVEGKHPKHPRDKQLKKELKELKELSKFKGPDLKPLGTIPEEDKLSEDYKKEHGIKNRYSDRKKIKDSVLDPRKIISNTV